MNERRIFHTAIAIKDRVERESYLDQVCGTGTPLRQRLVSLLETAEKNDDFLSTPILGPISSDNAGPSEHTAAPENGEVDDHHGDEGAKATVETLRVDYTPESIKLDFLTPSDKPGVLGRLGHYDVLELIGQGAFGLVLRARDEKLQRIVAIKVMQPHLAVTSPPRKRFLREARAGAGIRHQHVVSVYSVEEEPIPYLVMEYIKGGTLQDRIDDCGPLDPMEILPITMQLADALSAAHEQGLVHRDIKPSNILIEDSASLRAIVTDFGLARTVDDASMSQSGLLAGTPMYMSPEQSLGQSIDARSDLFSLGSVIYSMLTGRPPFRAPSTVAVLKRVEEASPRPIKEVIPEAPEWLCLLVERLHSRRPENRIQSAKEVYEWLQACQADLQRDGKVQSMTLKSLGKIRSGVEPMELAPHSAPAASATVGARLRAVGWDLGFIVVAIFLLGATLLWVVGKEGSTNSNSDSVAKLASPKSSHPVWSNLPSDAPSPAIAPFSPEVAASLQEQWADYLKLPVEFTSRLGIKFRLIPPGEFDMGISNEELEELLPYLPNGLLWEEVLRSEAPRHRVMITKPFYLATTEVTQHQFEAVASFNPTKFPPAYFEAQGLDSSQVGNHALEGPTWVQSAHFCRALSEREGLDWPYGASEVDFLRVDNANGYYMPSEAQWEFACRAGSVERYWSGDSITELRKVAHFADRNGTPMPVGQLKPNPFGLYDMHGNVYEWTQDRWSNGQYAKQAEALVVADPQGADFTSTLRVARGGDFYWTAMDCRAATRFPLDQYEDSGYAIGIRLALPIEGVRKLIDQPPRREPVLDFVEAHNLSLWELPRWLESLDKTYVPHMANFRETEGDCFVDIVAVKREASPPYIYRFVDAQTDQQVAAAFEQQFQQYRNTATNTLRLPVAASKSRPAAFFSVWLEPSTNSPTWAWGSDNIDELLIEQRDFGRWPVSLRKVNFADREEVHACFAYGPGNGHHCYFDLTLDQFVEQANEYRRRGWRPHLLQSSAAGKESVFTVAFRENLDQVAWEVQRDLPSEQYEQALVEKKAEGFYPLTVVSREAEDKILYTVVWEAMR